MEIKFKLKIILAIKGMTQLELAEATGVRQPTISAIATGKIKELPISVLVKICNVLECQPGDLMEYIPEDTSTK